MAKVGIKGLKLQQINMKYLVLQAVWQAGTRPT